MNILNLPNFNVLDVKETEDDYQIPVESFSPPSMYVHCGPCASDQPFGPWVQFRRSESQDTVHGRLFPNKR